MTTVELFEVFAHEYDANGMPILDASPEPIDEWKLFKEHYRLNCITDPETIKRDWEERQKAAASGRRR